MLCTLAPSKAQVISGKLDGIVIVNDKKISLTLIPSTCNMNELVSLIIRDTNYAAQLSNDSIWNCVVQFAQPSITSQLATIFNSHNTTVISIDKQKKCMYLATIQNSTKDLTLKQVCNITVEMFSTVKPFVNHN